MLARGVGVSMREEICWKERTNIIGVGRQKITRGFRGIGERKEDWLIVILWEATPVRRAGDTCHRLKRRVRMKGTVSSASCV